MAYVNRSAPANLRCLNGTAWNKSRTNTLYIHTLVFRQQLACRRAIRIRAWQMTNGAPANRPSNFQSFCFAVASIVFVCVCVWVSVCLSVCVRKSITWWRQTKKTITLEIWIEEWRRIAKLFIANVIECFNHSYHCLLFLEREKKKHPPR